MLAMSAGGVVWILCGLLLGVVIWRAGMGMMRSMAQPMSEPPPVGELRKVNVRYRCDVCGVELKLTLAPDQDPPPPRHCLEDMIVVAPLYD
jgi:hypothetical protein